MPERAGHQRIAVAAAGIAQGAGDDGVHEGGLEVLGYVEVDLEHQGGRRWVADEIVARSGGEIGQDGSECRFRARGRESLLDRDGMQDEECQREETRFRPMHGESDVGLKGKGDEQIRI